MTDTEDTRMQENIEAIWKVLEDREINNINELLPTMMTVLHGVRTQMPEEVRSEFDAMIHYAVDMFSEMPDGE